MFAMKPGMNAMKDEAPDRVAAWERGAPARRILLAEDDGELRSLLAWTLVEEGYDVVEARNGTEVLNYLEPRFLDARMYGRCQDVDLVISDLRMPGHSGMDLLSSLRRHDQVTPFVLMTAFGDDLTHARARELGASLVLDKPFDVDELLRILRRILPPL
jgi:DNA-binding response OmpR family regulator